MRVFSRAKTGLPRAAVVLLVLFLLIIPTATLLQGLPVAHADIEPPSIELTLSPGESTTVSKTLDIPEFLPKLDLYLLQDETGSFQDDLPILQSLAPQIFTDVSALSEDSRFGVGGFRDFPFDPWGRRYPGNEDFAYRLLQDMTSDSETFVGAINQLTADWGSDDPESQYEALYQAATGAGRIYLDYTIDPGQNPTFREDAFKKAGITEEDTTEQIQEKINKLFEKYPEYYSNDKSKPKINLEPNQIKELKEEERKYGKNPNSLTRNSIDDIDII